MRRTIKYSLIVLLLIASAAGGWWWFRVPSTPQAVIARVFTGMRASHHCIDTRDGARCYYRLLPETPARGLVMALHPAFYSVAQTESVVPLSRRLVKHGYAVLLPEGIGKQWNDGRIAQRAETYRRHVDDVGFLQHVLTHEQAGLSIPPARSIMAGMSNGGMMAMRFACERDGVAGIFTVVANLPKGLAARCKAAPKPMQMVFGRDDTVVPYAGGSLGKQPDLWGEVETVEDTIGFFVRRAGAQTHATIQMRDDVPEDGTRLEHRRYDAGSSHAVPIDAMVLHGMGHTWPNEPSDIYAWMTTRGRVSREVDGVALLLQFADATLTR